MIKTLITIPAMADTLTWISLALTDAGVSHAARPTPSGARIEIGVDDKDVKKAQRAIRQAFLQTTRASTVLAAAHKFLYSDN